MTTAAERCRWSLGFDDWKAAHESHGISRWICKWLHVFVEAVGNVWLTVVESKMVADYAWQCLMTRAWEDRFGFRMLMMAWMKTAGGLVFVQAVGDKKIQPCTLVARQSWSRRW